MALQPQTLLSFPSQGQPSRYEKAHKDTACNVINKNLFEQRDLCLLEGYRDIFIHTTNTYWEPTACQAQARSYMYILFLPLSTFCRCYYLHYIDNETSSERLRNCPEVIHLNKPWEWGGRGKWKGREVGGSQTRLYQTWKSHTWCCHLMLQQSRDFQTWHLKSIWASTSILGLSLFVYIIKGLNFFKCPYSARFFITVFPIAFLKALLDNSSWPPKQNNTRTPVSPRIAP